MLEDTSLEDTSQYTRDPNDFEFEVSRIDESPASVGDATGDNASPSPSRLSGSPFDARPAARRRVLAFITAVAVVALALVVILTALPGAGSALGTVLGFGPPTPTATLTTGADTVFLTNNVPWGTLTVDGQTHSISPPGLGATPLLRLTRGTHTLVYDAAPFPLMQCKVSVPASRTDTCPVAAANAAKGSGSGNFRTVDLQATPDRLPVDQYQSLAQAILSAVAAPDGILKPGDHYRGDTGTTTAAGATLSAHLVATLPARGTASKTEKGVTCDPLCPASDASSPAGNAWPLAAMLPLVWKFTDSHGQAVATAPAMSDSAVFVVVAATWSGAWTVQMQYSRELQQNLCVYGQGLLSKTLATIPAFSSGSYGGHTGTGGTPPDGCLIFVDTLAPASGGSSGSQYTVLYRFGALIAADSATAQAMPQLPLASANERAIIARLTITR